LAALHAGIGKGRIVGFVLVILLRAQRFTVHGIEQGNHMPETVVSCTKTTLLLPYFASRLAARQSVHTKTTLLT
jgi:hypothetical protein